jgi:hypothetical protein
MENDAKAQKTDPQFHVDSTSPASPTRLKTRRYTVVSAGENEPPTKLQATIPYVRITPLFRLLIYNRPKVHPSKDMPKHLPALDFRMYDAILSERKSTQASIPDPEMEKFLPLLKDYLKSK